MNEDFYKEQFTTQEVIKGLQDTRKEKNYNLKLQPLFSLAEFVFLKDLIFKKEKNAILISALDYISDKKLLGFGFSNTASLRRVLFFQHFLGNMGNATKAAIASGYSPNSAKQQGHRVLKWIQKQN